MTPIVNVPEKKYRLYDGTMATEYVYIQECIRILKTNQQVIEDQLEEMQRRLELAEGRPVT